jgi:hypothetical protein
MASLIEKENGMKFIFNDEIDNFELIKFVDKKENELNLIHFLNENEKHKEVMELLLNQKVKNNLIEIHNY